MKKVYVLFPALAMLIFFGYWWNFSSKYEAKQAAIKEVARQERIADLEKEADDRKEAIKAALATQEVRRREREAKETKRQADREQRQTDIEARRQADREKQKLERQLARLKTDVQTEKDNIAGIEEHKRVLSGDEAFLRKYVSLAENNEADITKVIERIAAADAARAKAIADAAAAKKS